MPRTRLKRAIFWIHRTFTLLGVHVLPAHYYSPVPNIPALEKSIGVWARRSEMPGIDWNLAGQAANLKQTCLPFQKEYTDSAFSVEASGRRLGPGYGPIESQALYAFIRHFKPARIVEVGGGASTFTMSQAARANAHEGTGATQITSIDPYPSDALMQLGEITLVPMEVQRAPFTLFESLRKGDVLFIDSSHTVKPGSDVNYLILEVLPRLHSGVFVHFHDIFFPFDYQRDVLRTFLHWSETSLIRAFLIGNSRVRILFSMSALHYDAPEVLKEVFPAYTRRDDINGLELPAKKPFEPLPAHFPSSLYLQTL
jgi:hypothetical protein